MNENQLKKEFSKRDVQRMRNIITGNSGGSVGTQIGYTKQYTDYQEGDVWEDTGKVWTIKNGIKQTVTKYDALKRLFVMPISCPHCNNPMKINEYNKKMWSIHKMCFDCVVDMETKIKISGKWDEYEKSMMNINKDAMVNDFEEAVNNFLSTKNESYINEQGVIESWGGGKINDDEIKNVKEYIKNLREQQL
jgi:hypothetical protein